MADLFCGSEKITKKLIFLWKWVKRIRKADDSLNVNNKVIYSP